MPALNAYCRWSAALSLEVVGVGLRAAPLATRPKDRSNVFFTIWDAMPLTGEDVILLRAACSSQLRCYTGSITYHNTKHETYSIFYPLHS